MIQEVLIGVLVTLFTSALLWVGKKFAFAEEIGRLSRWLFGWLRSLLWVKDVRVYLSERKDKWNLEVPKWYRSDLFWRLRTTELIPTNFCTPHSLHEDNLNNYSWRIAAYDQTFYDDAIEIAIQLTKLRINFTFVDDLRTITQEGLTDSDFHF